MLLPPRDHAARDSADDQSFEDLFRRYHERVLAYALRRTTPELAQDVLAETFAIAWRRWRDVPSDALPWLLGVARRVLANQRRAAVRQRDVIARLERQVPTTADLGDRLELDSLLAAFRRLPDIDREVLALVAWEGLEPREAAEVIGSSAAVFRLRLHRARRRLRRELDRLEKSSNPIATKAAKGATETT
jgi:RNA polymerase sigma-70 factor, ECF subfamily